MLGSRLPPRSQHTFVLEDNSSENPLNLLTDAQGTWKVYKVSAMYDLQYNVSKLKQYGNKIKQALSCHITEKATVKYRVDFGVDPELKKHPNDPHALMINIYKTNSGEAEVSSYSAVLMSWGVYSAVPRATHLPLLLERGKSQVAATVKLTLIKMFDCCISPFYFTKSNMLLFGILFCQLQPSEEAKGLSFCFKIPQSTYKNKITLTISVCDMLSICDRITEDEAEELTQPRLVELSYIALQRHVFLTGHMDISVLELVEVSHPKANVKTSGTVRLKSNEITSAVLDILNELLPN